MESQRKLNVVHDDDEHEKLLRQLREIREEFRIWQAVTYGVVAALSLLLGAILMVLYK